VNVVYKINGKEVSRAEFNKTPAKELGAPMGANTYRGHDPLMSDGIGCMKSQVPEMREVIRKHGIKGVTVQDSGRLEITSRQGRKDILRVRGMVDQDGGYGDTY